MTTRHRPSGTRVVLDFLLRYREAIAVLVAVILLVLFSQTSGGTFLNKGNLVSVLHVTAILGIVAAGESLVICSGEIDISVGSVFAMGPWRS